MAKSLPQTIGKALLWLVVSLAPIVALELICRKLEPKGTTAHHHALPPITPKQPGELRVLVYGESTVFGLPEPSVGPVKQLEYWLKKSYPDRAVNVVNLGAPAVSSAQIASTLAATVKQQPDVVVLMMGHNEYLLPAVQTSTQRTLQQRSALVRRLQRWLAPERLPDTLTPYPRGPEIARRVDAFRTTLTWMVNRAKQETPNVVLSTVAANLRDWAPVHRRLVRPDGSTTAAYEALIQPLEDLVMAGKGAEARGKIDQALTTYPNDAMLLYLRGKVRLAAGEAEAAHKDFVDAKDLDPYPWRALSPINDVTREVAKSTGATLVDLPAIFDQESKGSAPGFDFFADNCHPTPEGASVIAAALTRTVARLVPEGFKPALDAVPQPAEAFLADAKFKGSHTEVQTLLGDACYAMKLPFFDWVTSRTYLDRAAKIEPGNWEVWANLATISLLEGKMDEGKSELDKAKTLKGASLLPVDRAKTPYLGEALRQAGL
ncbi:MAG: hypothetical protein U0359_05785 [Byssovorax sp.]